MEEILTKGESMKENKNTTTNMEKRLEAIEKQLQVECRKCDGTGIPCTKTGEPARTGNRNVKCKDCGGTGSTGNRLDLIETRIEAIKKDIISIDLRLKTHINRQTAEIRVLPEGKNPKLTANWEDYTGVFYVDNNDEEEVVLEKAVKHYEEHFADGVWYKGRTLGIFLNGLAGKKLKKIMKIND